VAQIISTEHMPHDPTPYQTNPKPNTTELTMNEHTLTQLRSLRLDGMVRALEEQAASTAASALGFDERLSLLVQREVAWRDERRVERLLKAAKLKVSSACVEDINWRASRALDRSLVTALAGGDWIRNAQNLLITGATGCGKTWLACALAHQAARMGFSVLYTRAVTDRRIGSIP
jgi:DNA replication protein DnaC